MKITGKVPTPAGFGEVAGFSAGFAGFDFRQTPQTSSQLRASLKPSCGVKRGLILNRHTYTRMCARMHAPERQGFPNPAKPRKPQHAPSDLRLCRRGLACTQTPQREGDLA